MEKKKSWKYANHAKKRRECERCKQVLQPYEPIMCRGCRHELRMEKFDAEILRQVKKALKGRRKEREDQE